MLYAYLEREAEELGPLLPQLLVASAKMVNELFLKVVDLATLAFHALRLLHAPFEHLERICFVQKVLIPCFHLCNGIREVLVDDFLII